MEVKVNIVIIVLSFILIHSDFGLSLFRGRASDTEVFIEKDGDCPTNDMVSSFVDDVCEKECFLDIDCDGVQKCCQNGCGGTQCQLPNQHVNRCEDFPCDGQGQTCEVLDDQPSCVCQTNCTDDVEMVCADDGQVYTGRCWMDMAACEQGIIINKTPCTESLEPPTEAGVPSMLFGPRVVTADEYQDVRIFCDAASQSTVSYAWIVTQPDVNMEVLLPGNTLDNIAVSFDGKVLIISSVRDEDAGNYGCLASNIHGLSAVTHKLIVNSQETPTTQLATTLAQGNENLVTAQDLHSSVEQEISSPNEACVQDLHRGRCFRQEVRWFYNIQSQRCEPFMYGGCGGNSNRFLTYEQCSRACPSLPVDPCRHPIATGRCRAMIRRWAYEEETGECVEFVYGGCGANGNNFRTREECGYTCLDREARKQNCECVRPKLKSSFCRSDFVIMGRIRQEIISPVNGALLVIELQALFKVSDALEIRSGGQVDNITMVRDMSRSPRGCNCLTFTQGDSYIFMGRINEHGEAMIDDDSYVSPGNGKRQARINTPIRCNENGDATVLRPREARREGTSRHPQTPHGIDQVEGQVDQMEHIKPMALPVYQRKVKKMSRNRLRKKI